MALSYMVYINQDPDSPKDWLGFSTFLVTHNLATATGKYAPFTEKPGPGDQPADDENVARKELHFISIHKRFMAVTDDSIDLHTLHQLMWIEQSKLSFDGSIQLSRYSKDAGPSTAVNIVRLFFTGKIASHITASRDTMGFNFEIVGDPTLEDSPVAARTAPPGRSVGAIA